MIKKFPEQTGFVEALDDLSDVSLAGIATGDFLMHNGSEWVNSTQFPHYMVQSISVTAGGSMPVDTAFEHYIQSGASSGSFEINNSFIEAMEEGSYVYLTNNLSSAVPAQITSDGSKIIGMDGHLYVPHGQTLIGMRSSVGLSAGDERLVLFGATTGVKSMQRISTLYSGNGAVETTLQFCDGLNVNSPAVSVANTYYTALNVSAAGYLYFAAVMRAVSSAVGTPSVKIIIDGTTIYTWSAAISTQWNGYPIVGSVDNGDIAGYMPIRFTSSLKIDITSTSTDAANSWKFRVVYGLD